MTDIKSKEDMVTLIENPYGLSNTDISRAQNSSEPLELDEPTDPAIDVDAIDISSLCEELAEDLQSDPELKVAEIDQDQFARLDAAMDEVEAQVQTRAEEAAIEEAQLAAEELAAQIAEDEALAAQLALEAEQDDANDAELQAALPKIPETNESGELDLHEMESCIEAILFISDKPLSTEKIREMLGPDFPMNVFQEALTALCDRYKSSHHGIELCEIAGGFQFRTKPGRAALAKKLAKIQTQRLSSGAMETLAIIAYKQPAMKEDIDKIRGVDSSHFIRGLLDKKLIEITGRSELPGRPMLYATSKDFLEVFGLKNLSAMPPLHEVEKMIPASQTGNPGEDDPRIKEMRRLVDQMKSDTSTSLIYNPREDEKILKEIKEQVNAIPVSTPYLDMQKEAEKQAKLEATHPVMGANGTPGADEHAKPI